MINFRRDDEALLAAALTGFTWSSVGLVEDKNNPIIRASQNNDTGISNTYPTMQMWKPILASCPDSNLLIYPQFGVLFFLAPQDE